MTKKMNKKILIAEDSADARKLISIILRSAGHEVVEASDGHEALGFISKNCFDLLITDLNMPRLDGIGLIRAVRKTEENCFLPIIMLTGETGELKRAEGKAAGASIWITKPFKKEQLLTVVRSVLPESNLNIAHKESRL